MSSVSLVSSKNIIFDLPHFSLFFLPYLFFISFAKYSLYFCSSAMFFWWVYRASQFPRSSFWSFSLVAWRSSRFLVYLHPMIDCGLVFTIFSFGLASGLTREFLFARWVKLEELDLCRFAVFVVFASILSILEWIRKYFKNQKPYLFRSY